MEKLHNVVPVLYSFRRCPYAMRARLAIAVSGLTCELREVVLRDKPAELLSASPKGTVPVLALDANRVLEESLDIMFWALTQRDPEDWLRGYSPHGPAAKMITECDRNFKFHLDRYKYSTRFPDDDSLAHRHCAAGFLQDLDACLGEGAYLGGDRRGLADVAIFPFVRQFAQTDPHWFAAQPWENLHAWLVRFDEWPLFHAVMKKAPPWRPGDAPIHLLPES
jgi:glutathione S-transferase